MKKQRYSLGVSVQEDGTINYAGLNDNFKLGYIMFKGDTQFPLFVHERIALLKVKDSYQTVMLGIGRKLVDGLYTIYLNAGEHKELLKLKKEK
jgi:ribosomal protein S18 acetylase RimI-like enzyme